MPRTPLSAPTPANFDFARLAEQLVRHCLAQPDLAALFTALSQPAQPRATLQRLLDIFRHGADILSLRAAMESRVPSSDSLGVVTSGLADAVGARLCRLIFGERRRGGFVVLRGDGSLGDEPPREVIGGISKEVLMDGMSRAAVGLAASEMPAGETVREMLCVALRRGAQVIGVMQLFDKAQGNFTDADRDLAEAAAPIVAELAARVGVLAASEGGARGPVRLIEQHRPTEDLSGRELILSKILAVAIDVLDADRAAVFSYDPLTEELGTRQAEGLGARELRIDSGLGLVGAAFRTGEIVNVADAYLDARFNPALDWQTGYRTRSVLCAPIDGNDGRRVGVVQLLNKRRGVFTEADERRLRGLASQMGITIDYAALFEQTLSMKSYNESMLRSLSNGVITVDLARVVTFVNQAACKILRIDGESAVGRRLGEIFDGLNGWVVQSVEDSGLDGAEKLLLNSEFYIDGEDAWVGANLTLVPLRDGKQTPLGTMIVIEDLQRENELRRTMSRYLPNEVIDRLMDDQEGGLGGSSHEATILFSDIRDFTALAERLGAGETVSMLNEYFSFMEDVVTNRGGMVDKYIGDAIMALFGSPFPTDNDAGNAVRAAIDMFQALQILNARRAAENKAAIRIGVGIGTGNVVTGNIGSPKRMDFTVIGDSVNLASRMEAATKLYGADILVCGTTWARLKAAPRARRVDVVRLRGQTKPTDVWEIVEHRPDISDDALAAYACALDAYRAGEWTRALDRFAEAVALRPDDKAATLMAERCHRFVDTPPGRWDGVADLD
ncbi:MAG TPA: adenylate/guanylate cyclase domain-containing protein [Stellaceae bacterium]|nr:adenylate/guanylate cyclase domain-containing protein [Stellaceae bacterium]